MKKVHCILLVDDNPADNEFHKIQIKKADACEHVRVVTDGEQALFYLLKAGEGNYPDLYPKPDLIFLDINMPGMNGFEFLEEYKHLDDSVKSKVVVVMLTTSLNPADEQRALATKQVKRFENKPLTAASLREILEGYF